MFSNATFWVGVAFVIFMALAWRMGAFRQIAEGLDSRGRRVRAELEEAQRLRAEADALLAEYKRRREEAEREAQDIVNAAREDAERVARETQERMAEFVRRRTAAAEAKIAQAEASAAQQVRAAAAEAAVRISEAVLSEQMRGGAGEDLLVRSLSEVRGKLHS
ncbi:ATP F0F1 synthase subunit B [Enterovirga aerilata]|uniref:ATP synthase subunit b n=1 Tax=Enterovirga aerilata TaxID=2730920 RepID=A0A849I0X8_9HYPH|nr:ATP F0F1 synthase subunit B [Enterovirga sp. DB1703]NNM73002.1 ATP F0F1 synthase subunit B [Enterovirga sp. DB1703]